MKRLLLGSLLSFLSIGQLCAAASNSHEDAEREKELNRKEIEKLCALPLQERLLNALIDESIIDLGGKIAPTYSSITEYSREASEEDVLYREEYRACIQDAARFVRALMPHLSIKDPACTDMVNRHEEKLLRKWNHEGLWKSEANVGTRMYTTYVFPAISQIEAQMRKQIRDKIVTGFQSTKKFHPTAHPYRGAPEEYGYTINWHEFRAAEMEFQIDEVLREYDDSEEAPMKQRANLRRKRELLIPIADRAKALIVGIEPRIRQLEAQRHEARQRAEHIWAEEQKAIAARAASAGVPLSATEIFRMKMGPMGCRASADSDMSLRNVFITEIERAIAGEEPRIGISDPGPRFEGASSGIISGFNN